MKLVPYCLLCGEMIGLVPWVASIKVSLTAGKLLSLIGELGGFRLDLSLSVAAETDFLALALLSSLVVTSHSNQGQARKS